MRYFRAYHIYTNLRRKFTFKRIFMSYTQMTPTKIMRCFMDIQMVVLIVLSIMLVIKIVYLVVFKRPEQQDDEHSHDHHSHSHHSHGRHYRGHHHDS